MLAENFRMRFSNFVSLWCFRGGRSATTGLTFIPCPHWVLRPHLNCLTLWGPRLFQHKNHKWPLLQPVDLCQSLSKAALCCSHVKSIYSEKAQKFHKISILVLTLLSNVKTKMEIWSNFCGLPRKPQL